MTKSFYSHGKLLLTSEYLVLDGAKALALPTKKGQQLRVKEIASKELEWKSILDDGTIWMEFTCPFPITQNIENHNPLQQRLIQIFLAAQTLNPSFLSGEIGYEATSTLEFQKDWGLGSSSTLIANVAIWAQVDPYELLENTFGGSGYDIACANANGPITYERTEENPITHEVVFDPSFKEQLFFVYLNKKQNSRESIHQYRSIDKSELPAELDYFSGLTDRMLHCKDLFTFQEIINSHENRLSKLLKTPTIKSRLFSDYPHAIKSLGGWGGDFILVTGTASEMTYFREKGFETIISYDDMIL